MKTILVATEKPFAPKAVDLIRQITDDAGYKLQLLEKYTEKSELLRAVEGVEALIIRSDVVDAEVLDAAKSLKVVVRAGSGYDNIDLETCTRKGVVAMNTPGQNANAVAELVVGMMVYFARNQFNGKPGTELRGKKLGICAFGNVGKQVARIAQGFDMTVHIFDPYVEKKQVAREELIFLSSEEELYRTCQYVSLHMPLNDETRRSVNYSLLSLMPQGAVLVNTARKEIVDEDSLVRMFRERPDFGYVSDIAPDNKDLLEKEFPGRFYFTPKKMGAQTAEANINAGVAAARQIVDYFKKGDTRFQVNK